MLYHFYLLYSQNCVNWHLLPHADNNIRSKSILIQGRFMGDPSFDYEHTVTHRVGGGNEEDSEEKTVTVSPKATVLV